jgi:uncharacterized protein YfdQ (DUF2303 family)
MTTENKKTNVAETMRDVMRDLSKHGNLDTSSIEKPFSQASLITLPQGRTVHDLTKQIRDAAEFIAPARRKGTAQLQDLVSLIDWANRFKGDASALFADNTRTAPSLTCVANYHVGGAFDPNPSGDTAARHCDHRGVYRFPLSDEWKAWTEISGKPLDKDDMGEFIEANAKDLLDPTPPVLQLKHAPENEAWENRLIATAQQIEGRFGQIGQLLAMSRQFQVYETSNLEVSSNRDTGEQSVQFLNEHRDKDGAPLKIPNLLIIAIPVFAGGAPYRMPVRFRYRKNGGSIKFILSAYNPDKAFDAAFDEALQMAKQETALPLFMGKPEA